MPPRSFLPTGLFTSPLSDITLNVLAYLPLGLLLTLTIMGRMPRWAAAVLGVLAGTLFSLVDRTGAGLSAFAHCFQRGPAHQRGRNGARCRCSVHVRGTLAAFRRTVPAARTVLSARRNDCLRLRAARAVAVDPAQRGNLAVRQRRSAPPGAGSGQRELFGRVLPLPGSRRCRAQLCRRGLSAHCDRAILPRCRGLAHRADRRGTGAENDRFLGTVHSRQSVAVADAGVAAGARDRPRGVASAGARAQERSHPRGSGLPCARIDRGEPRSGESLPRRGIESVAARTLRQLQRHDAAAVCTVALSHARLPVFCLRAQDRGVPAAAANGRQRR